MNCPSARTSPAGGENAMELEELQRRIHGGVTNSTDTTYESMRRAIVWNQLVPERYPRVIVAAASEDDVMAAVDFARAHRLKVAVRGGGHNWVGFSLRDRSLLIDLGELKRVISIDAKAHTATVQPAVRGRELNAALAKSGFVFPVGHRPTVPLSGFLLNGGLGCNFGGWGPGCLSIEAANVVIADGRLVVASDTRHPDLLWAIRGAGPGFFGVITQYRLKTRPTPRAITACDYFYPMERCEHCRQDAEGSRADAVLYRRAPPLAVQEKWSKGYVALLKATAFADTKAEAAAALAPLEGGPASLGLLSKE